MSEKEIMLRMALMAQEFAKYGATIVEDEAEPIYTLTQQFNKNSKYEFCYSVHPSPGGLFVKVFHHETQDYEMIGIDDFESQVLTELRQNLNIDSLFVVGFKAVKQAQSELKQDMSIESSEEADKIVEVLEAALNLGCKVTAYCPSSPKAKESEVSNE